MYTRALGGRQVIDAPPTHLQEHERDDQYPQSQALSVVRPLTIVDIDEIGEPGDGSPRLLRIPRPVMSPGLLRPERTKHHAEGHKDDTYENKVVNNMKILLLDKQVDGHDSSDTHQRVAHDIDQDVREEPRTL